MGKSLELLLPDAEMAEIEALAQRQHMTVGEWVVRAIGDAKTRGSKPDTRQKLEAVRRAASYSFPAGEIRQMLDEIEAGYRP